ncbi:MAG: DUF4331 domain-containing protein [Acidimicrobiia bacterium]
MRVSKHRRRGLIAFGGLVGVAVAAGMTFADASSHREAPLITEDPVADNTDVYAFVAPDEPGKVNIVANWIPLEQPNGGPNFHKFGDDVLYTIRIDNDGDAVEDIAYEFRFTTKIVNPGTFLYNTNQVTALDDPDLNVRQSYSVTEVRKNGRGKVLARNLQVAPANIGPRSTPNYDALAAAATYTLPNGFKVFAGPRDDPFFVDLGSIFDLGGLRPLNAAHLIPLPAEGGVDGVAGYNTHTIAIQAPRERFTRDDKNPVIGVWSATYRRGTKVLRADGSAPLSSGNWVQVSRLGMPLVNEVVIPLGQKDRFNASRPKDDAQFAANVTDPELARLIPVLYPGVNVPPAPRNDIASIFLTGIADLNQPAKVQASEMLRLNTMTPPTPFASQDRLGLLAGQNDGFPNGRRLIDDVTDIELRALAGGTPFTPDFNVFPNNALTDGVDANDKPFLQSFPYLASPHQGYEAD